jgi:hypothetical protein
MPSAIPQAKTGATTVSTPKQPRLRRALRNVARGLLMFIAAYLVVRAIMEPFLVNPFRSETYRHDWGGPHYLGVMLVHDGPGLIVAILAGRRIRRTHSARDTSPAE